MSVVGFDDDRLARLSHVALPTVAQDTEQLTAHAVARLDGTTVTTRELVIPPTSSSAARPRRRPRHPGPPGWARLTGGRTGAAWSRPAG